MTFQHSAIEAASLDASLPPEEALKLIPGHDPNCTQLFRPREDTADPEISIVVPALNEQVTIEEFVTWCHLGLQRQQLVAKF